MIIPVRCFTCGKVISSYYEEYDERVRKGEKPSDVLDSMHINRYCCRRMLISNVELIEEVSHY
ncbi:MAG: DNA-directed RNA polymerase subunit N [Candidatus Thermoplasmatota archaeon]|nr:DNA-directed RNA polymerase subunit N [Candidatus Thermoplasmatota archaeon]MCL5962958.1 DNA-directed RNA polymerase subunit N [Candidatus Thermoplasmatota archaeon]